MGTVYGPIGPVDDRTMDLAHDNTPMFGFMAFAQQQPPPRRPDRYSNLLKALAIAGGILLVVVLCGIGVLLTTWGLCPCTIGAEPVPTQQQVSITTSSPYDTMSCASEGGTS